MARGPSKRCAAAAVGPAPSAPAGDLRRLAAEVVGEILHYLQPADLLRMEAASRYFAVFIAGSSLWRALFEARCTDKSAHAGRPACRKDLADGVDQAHLHDPVAQWKMPPPRLWPTKNWKSFYHQYDRETRAPRCVLKRSDISRKYIYRVPGLCGKLCNPQPCMSPSFSIDYTVHVDPLTGKGGTKDVHTAWSILLQASNSKDNIAQLGIFVKPKQNVRCRFSLAAVDHDYKIIQHCSVEKEFEEDGTCGWLFPRNMLKEKDMIDEVIIELDITVYPENLACVEHFYQLIENTETEDDLKRVIVSSLGDFVTHLSPNPTHAKRYIQQMGGGPLPLVRVFEDKKTTLSLKAAAAGCMWNILDTSTMYIAYPILERLVSSACSTLMEILHKEKHLTISDPQLEDLDNLDLSSIPFYFTPSSGVRQRCVRGEASPSPAPSADAEADDFGRQRDGSDLRGLVNSLCGLMWNIPVAPDKRYTPPFFLLLIVATCNV
ncbi:hypothetical protein DIPPA_11535 [Diplonema papillatum]|nr:hypothetical protein DIPPA_11535 [Diplonema papillatum]